MGQPWGQRQERGRRGQAESAVPSGAGTKAGAADAVGDPGQKCLKGLTERNGEPWWDRTTDLLNKSSDPDQPEHTTTTYAHLKSVIRACGRSSRVFLMCGGMVAAW